MATVSSSPTEFYNFFSTRLRRSMTSASQTSGIVLTRILDNNNSARTLTTKPMFFRFSDGSKQEIVSAGGWTQDADGHFTLTDVVRDVDPDDGDSYATGSNPVKWASGTLVEAVVPAQLMNKIAFTDVANTFTENQTIDGTDKIYLNDTGTYIYDDGTDLKFKDSNNSETSLSTLAATGGSDEKVGISSNDTTPDYLVNKITGGDGITATETTDGGDETLDIDVDLATDPGLEFDSGELRVKVKSGGGITRDSDGLSVAGGSIPTGAMFQWLTDTAPSGYLLCYGQAVSRETYSDLFGVIADNYGVGDGSTTFNVPDLRGRFPLGQDDMGGSSADRVTATEADSLGGVEGAETHTLTDSEVPAQSVEVSTNNSGSQSTASHIRASSGTLSVSTASHDKNTYNTEGGGGAHNNMPPYITVNYIIKT